MQDTVRQVGALQIGVTSAMIDAGVDALCDYEPGNGVTPPEAVKSIFLAMLFAKFPVANVGENRERPLGLGADFIT